MLILNIVLKIEYKTWEALSFAGHIDVPQNICAEPPQASGPGKGMVLGGQVGSLLITVVKENSVCLLLPRV